MQPCSENKSASVCFCGRMPPKWGPCGAASGWRKSPKGRAQDAREGAARTGMCAQRLPEPAREPGGQDARKARYLGCVSFGYLSLHKQRKVTRSPEGRVKALHFKRQQNKGADCARLLSRALRAIRCANVRSGILPPQSGLTSSAVESRRNDERKKPSTQPRATRVSAPRYAAQALPPGHWSTPTSIRAPRGR